MAQSSIANFYCSAEFKPPGYACSLPFSVQGHSFLEVAIYCWSLLTSEQ